MRLIKMLGLVVLAVLAMTAAAGTTSASATTSLEKVVVCKLDVMHSTQGCPSNETFGSGTEVYGQLLGGTETVLLTNLGNVRCNESVVEGTTTSSLAHGTITKVTFGLNGEPFCKLGETNCLVTVERLPYLVSVLLMSDHLRYEAIISSGGLGAPKALVNCGSFTLKCLFTISTVFAEVVLETNDTVWDIEQEMNREGGSGYFCPSTSAWDAKYLVRCFKGALLVSCWPAMEEGSVL
jgi:hypothetical protein